MHMSVLLLCLLVAAASATGTPPCQASRSVLVCHDISLEQLTSHYSGENLLRLVNVTGFSSWNTTGLNAVNTIIASHVHFTHDAFKDLLSMPHLSTLEISDSDVEIKDGGSMFVSDKLRNLRLRASLKAPVPGFFNFTQLSEFDISGNKLFAVPRIHAEKLVYLNLSSTGIRFVENLETLPFLEELDISRNGLRRIDADAFAKNVELDKLWVQHNDLREVKFSAPRLMYLNLNYNDLETVRGEFFAGLSAVTNLMLIGNNILEMVEPFKFLPRLKMLDLSDNDLAVLEGKWFEHTPELEVMRVSHNGLLMLPALTAPLHSLHHLNLSSNRLQALNEEFFKQTRDLAVLDVTHNQLKSLDAALTHIKQLNKLYASRNYLEITERTFDKSDVLNFADLSYNNLTIGARVFEKARSLRDVDLSHNNIQDFCVAGQPPAFIQNLDISFNKLKSISCLTELSSLFVAANPLVCDLVTPPQPTPRSVLRTVTAPSGTSDIATSNSSTVAPDVQDGVLAEDDGDWQEEYLKRCPQGATPVSSLPTISRKVTFDITENPLSDLAPRREDSDESDEDDDDDDDDDEDDDEEADDENVLTRSGKADRVGVRSGKLDDAGYYEPLATWAFVLLGICLVLLLINLLMFVWYRRRERREARLSSDRPYEQLHNEVYKNTTTRLGEGAGVHRADLSKYFSTFKTEKLNHMIVRLGLRNNMATDAESQARMIPTNQIA